jgi:hypothetical protein
MTIGATARRRRRWWQWCTRRASLLHGLCGGGSVHLFRAVWDGSCAACSGRLEDHIACSSTGVCCIASTMGARRRGGGGGHGRRFGAACTRSCSRRPGPAARSSCRRPCTTSCHHHRQLQQQQHHHSMDETVKASHSLSMAHCSSDARPGFSCGR